MHCSEWQTSAECRGDWQWTAGGRVPGEQTNTTAEAHAMLEALLRTHPNDDVHMYTDNAPRGLRWPRGLAEMNVLAHLGKPVHVRVMQIPKVHPPASNGPR